MMDAILAHGLPADAPLLVALDQATSPLFFDDTAATPVTAGFPDLGVASLAAAPVRGRHGGLLGAFLMHTFEQHDWTESEADLVAAVANALAALTARLVAEEDAVAAREGAIRALGLALESRDGETKGHTDRVTDLAIRLGTVLGLSDDDLSTLRWGAYLHDIGKIGVPDAILRKPGKLDDVEWEVMREHVALGHSFATRLPFLPPDVLNVVGHHHERWDSTGYPDGLSGEDIPLSARVFALCDVYDALTSERPYKRPWTHDDAVAEIAAQSGKQFDPTVVTAFLALNLDDFR
jgi:putative nucleotidyltransferase with HDIG domain